MHHYVQCLKNKIDNIEVFLSTENIDILCVSESWIQDNEIIIMFIPKDYVYIVLEKSKNSKIIGYNDFTNCGDL